MGTVYLGRGQTGRAVAVKVVREDLASNPDYRRRFAEEVAAMRDVGAAHTAAVLAADLQATPQWVVMEYVQGPTLATRVGRAGPLPPDELRSFALGLLRAVASVHAAGVAHRDLKPSNVVLSPEGVRLLDFGVAKSPTRPVESGERVGSLTWMAPEQIAGRPSGPACDVHGIGMLLYFAATGRHVFGYGTPDAVAWRIGHMNPQLIDLPVDADDYRDLIRACLAKEPERRPPLKAVYDRLRSEDLRLPSTESGTSVERGSRDATEVIGGERKQAPPMPPDGVAGPRDSRAGPPEQVRRPGPPRQGDAGHGTGVALAPPQDADVGPRIDQSGRVVSFLVDPAEERAEERLSKRRRRSRVRFRVAVLLMVLLLVWMFGWAFSLWPLGGPLAPAATSQHNCLANDQPAQLSSWQNIATEGGGAVNHSLLGPFPGPFGEFKVPTRGIACEIGKDVRVTCAQLTLPDGANLACNAWDSAGGTSWVGISREGERYTWELRG